MTLHLRWAKLRGFRSFRDPAFFDLKQSGLVHIAGGNGVGKSSLMEAVYWCLFGKTSRGVKAGNVKSWNSKGKPACIVTVRVEKNTVATDVTRTWGPNTLRLGEKDVTQDEVNELIGLSDTEFLHAVYHAQFSPSFLDLSPTQQLELYSQILELDVWEQASDAANKAARAVGVEVTEIDRSISRMEGEEQEIARNDKETEARASEWLGRQKGKVALAKKDVQAIEKLLALLPASYTEQALFKARKAEMEAQAGAKRLEREMIGVQTEIATLNRSADLAKRGTCPTCGQRLPEHAAHTHAEITAAKRREFDRVEKKFEQAMAAVSSATRNTRSIEGTLEARSAKQQQVSEARKTLRAIEQETNPYHEQGEEVKKKLLQVRLELHRAHGALRKAKRQESRYAFWVKGFRDLRLWLIEESLTQLELEVNSVLQDLGLDGWQMQFDVEKENKSGGVKRGFTVLVLSPENETAVPWEVWSGGESQRLRIAAMMGVSNLILAQRGTPYSVEFYDEPSTWLTEEGVDALLRLLEQRAQATGRAIFIADHRALQFGGFSKVVNVSKGRKGSECE